MIRKKHINLKEARNIKNKFCEDFDLEKCEIYFVDIIGDKYTYGEYVWYYPLILLKERNPCMIGILIHELTHHLEWCKYKDEYQNVHGKNYQSSKKRVITWCKNNINARVDWRIPLKAKVCDEELKNIRL